MWALTALLTVCSLILLLYLSVVAGIDPNTGVNPRVQPFAALAMAVIVLVIVLSVFLLGNGGITPCAPAFRQTRRVESTFRRATWPRESAQAIS